MEQKEAIKILEEMIKPEGMVNEIDRYSITKTDSRKFYKKNGIDEKTLKSVADTTNLLVNSAIKIATDKLVNNEEANSALVKISTDLGNYTAKAHKNVRQYPNPQNKDEKITKKGGIDIKCVIKPLLDKELVEECKQRIEKVVKL